MLSGVAQYSGSKDQELVRTGATNHQEARISLLDFILQVKLGFVVIAVVLDRERL